MGLAAVVSFAGVLRAQETSPSLGGVIRNETGRGIEQAQVILDSGSVQRELRTNGDGRFRFAGVSVGRHRLRVLRIGFQPRDTAVAVTGAVTDVTISLQRLTSLTEVAVRARPMGVYGTVLERDSLRPVAGARVALLGGRLGDNERACLFVNGVARPNATIRDFSVEEIESIEVYGFRSEFTNTLGKRWPRRDICGNLNARPLPGNRAQFISIWTRR